MSLGGLHEVQAGLIICTFKIVSLLSWNSSSDKVSVVVVIRGATLEQIEGQVWIPRSSLSIGCASSSHSLSLLFYS